jgi:hypothetical protein
MDRALVGCTVAGRAAISRRPARVSRLDPGATAIKRERDSGKTNAIVSRIRTGPKLGGILLRTRAPVNKVIPACNSEFRMICVDRDSRLVLMILWGSVWRAAITDKAHFPLCRCRYHESEQDEGGDEDQSDRAKQYHTNLLLF